jgi:hypothetical protein
VTLLVVLAHQQQCSAVMDWLNVGNWAEEKPGG